MSYILEALKKADAAREREREAVPGLHSRHDHALPDEPDERVDATSAARTPWLIAGIAGGVVITGALFWLLGRSHPDATLAGETRPTPLQGQVTEAAAAPTAAALTPAPAPVTPAAPPPATVQVAPAQPPAAQAERPSAPQPVVVAAPPPAVVARVPAPPTPKPVADTPPQDPLRVDSALRETGPKIVPVHELPDNIRRELPALSVGGAMHSDVAANRMLVLNGGVFREGDQPAPGLVLEEIRLKSAVLRYKGHRYSISY